MKQPIFKKILFTLCLAGGMLFLGQTAFLSAVSAGQKAVSINAAADYSSGTFSVICAEPVGGPRDITNDINPTVSDLGLNTYGKYFYVIERYFGDNITKYDITNPTVPIWQYSVMDDNDTVASSNPHAIVFAGPENAYVIRNNSDTAWIVNPEAASQEDFKTGTLDLSAYNDQDDFGPEMTSGIVVKNKLFIILQRLNQNDSYAPNDAYVAVFDITTNQEINTGKGGSLNGILLPVKNPQAIVYEPSSDLIYVSGQGRLASSWSGTPADYSGGIVFIDPDTYDTTLVLDDGDDTDHPYGNITKMTILSQNKGYFVGYTGWGDNTLYEFNPITGVVAGKVNDWLENKNISSIIAGAFGDENGLLWVGNSTDAEIVIINPADNSIDETLSTNLNPSKIAFVSDDQYIFHDAQAGATSFADLFTDYSPTATYYQLWTGNLEGTQGNFVDTTAFYSNGKGWIEKDDLSQLLVDFAQTGATALWVRSWDPVNQYGAWAKGSVDFSTALEGKTATTISGSLPMFQLFIDYNRSSQAWYQIWLEDTDGSGSGAYVDTSHLNEFANGWVKPENLSQLTYALPEGAASQTIWVRLYTKGKHYGWIKWDIARAIDNMTN